jgi:hypothetical protein
LKPLRFCLKENRGEKREARKTFITFEVFLTSKVLFGGSEKREARDEILDLETRVKKQDKLPSEGYKSLDGIEPKSECHERSISKDKPLQANSIIQKSKKNQTPPKSSHVYAYLTSGRS